MPSARTASALCLTVLLTIAGAQRAAGRCIAAKALPCTISPYYSTPDLTLALSTPSIPDLTVLDFNPATDLRTVLPYNDAIRLLNKYVPMAFHNCSTAMLPGTQVLKLANSKETVGWAQASGLAMCSGVPLETAAKNPPYYVFGAFDNLASLNKFDLQGLPTLTALKNDYSAIGPNMGMCVGLDPCAMNVFVGLKGVTKPVSVAGQGIALALYPQTFYYSWSVNVAPPEWRAPGSAPTFWQVDNAAYGSPGADIPLGSISSVTGRLFLSGKRTLGTVGQSLASLPSATMNLGGQSYSWVLFRDELRLSVSTRLTTLPDTGLWGKLDLELSKVPGVKGVDLLTRRPTDQFWMRTTGPQAIRARRMVINVPAIGEVVSKVLAGAAQNTDLIVTRLDLYGAGAQGAGLRLIFRPGTFPLTAQAAQATGSQSITGPLTIILRADPGMPVFGGPVTIVSGKQSWTMQFCAAFADCNSAQHASCDGGSKLCVPKPAAVKPSGSVSAASLDTGVVMDPAAGGDVTPVGSRLVGQSCKDYVDCAPSLACMEVDEALGTKLCVEGASL